MVVRQTGGWGRRAMHNLLSKFRLSIGMLAMLYWLNFLPTHAAGSWEGGKDEDRTCIAKSSKKSSPRLLNTFHSIEWGTCWRYGATYAKRSCPAFPRSQDDGEMYASSKPKLSVSVPVPFPILIPIPIRIHDTHSHCHSHSFSGSQASQYLSQGLGTVARILGISSVKEETMIINDFIGYLSGL